MYKFVLFIYFFVNFQIDEGFTAEESLSLLAKAAGFADSELPFKDQALRIHKHASGLFIFQVP